MGEAKRFRQNEPVLALPVMPRKSRSLTPDQKWRESVSGSDDRLHVVVCVYPEFFPQPADVHIQGAWAYLGHVAPDVHQENRSGHNLSCVLHQ